MITVTLVKDKKDFRDIQIRFKGVDRPLEKFLLPQGTVAQIHISDRQSRGMIDKLLEMNLRNELSWKKYTAELTYKYIYTQTGIALHPGLHDDYTFCLLQSDSKKQLAFVKFLEDHIYLGEQDNEELDNHRLIYDNFVLPYLEKVEYTNTLLHGFLLKLLKERLEEEEKSIGLGGARDKELDELKMLLEHPSSPSFPPGFPTSAAELKVALAKEKAAKKKAKQDSDDDS